MDANLSKYEKELALKQVRSKSEIWMKLAISIVPNLQDCLPLHFLAEDLRHELELRIGKPHHSNVYGALTRTLLQKGLIIHTNKWLPMKLVASHARMSPLYRLAND